jgi:hypothetical protein
MGASSSSPATVTANGNNIDNNSNAATAAAATTNPDNGHVNQLSNHHAHNPGRGRSSGLPRRSVHEIPNESAIVFSDEGEDNVIENTHELHSRETYRGATTTLTATMQTQSPSPPPAAMATVGKATTPDTLNDVTRDSQRVRREIERERIVVMDFGAERKTKGKAERN